MQLSSQKTPEKHYPAGSSSADFLFPLVKDHLSVYYANLQGQAEKQVGNKKYEETWRLRNIPQEICMSCKNQLALRTTSSPLGKKRRQQSIGDNMKLRTQIYT